MTTNTLYPKDEARAARYRQQQQRRRNSIAKIQNSSSYSGPGLIIALSLGLMAAIAFFAAMLQVKTAEAFVARSIPTKQQSSSTRIFLEDWVAEMIDNELYRQQHHEEYEAAWMEKNKGAVVTSLNDGESSSVGMYPSQMMDEGHREAFAEHKRDERMAFLKPDKYCADRCLATGNCDILEDFYELGPEDVLKFCEECVLNFEDEALGCDVPAAFYEKEPPLRP